jgi:S1-C subfamily serine protease
VFVTGDAKLGGVVDSVVICDGSIELPSGLSNSVLVARKGVVLTSCTKSAVLAGGAVTLGTAIDSLVRAKKSIEVSIAGNSVLRSADAVRVIRTIGQRANIIEEKTAQKDVFGLLKFFDPGRLGITVRLVGTSLHITAVELETAIGRAGLKVGDVIVSLDKAKPASAEELRKLLRRSELEGRAVFSVRRGDTTLQIPVIFCAKEQR